MRNVATSVALVSSAWTIMGCDSPGSSTLDAASSADAGATDAALIDARTPAPDSGDIDGGSVDASEIDAHPPDALPPDALPPDALPPDALPPDAAGCGNLAADPTDVYVDKTSLMASVGTVACPFITIGAATDLAAPGTTRTIHLRGGTPALVYSESAVVVLREGETLMGDGEATTRITGGSRCTIGDCTVSVRKGRLSGVTVISATGSAVEVPTSNDGSSIDNVTARNSAGNGFYVRSSTNLDKVTSRGNGRDGLNARTAVVNITDSSFDGNDMRGIFADRDVVLNVRGGSVSSNRSDGISLQNSATVTGAIRHTLTGIQIVQNLGYGIFAAGTASIRLRTTTMRGNEAGLVFRYGASNTLDIGTAGESGGNVFGGATPGQRNIRAGLCLEQSGASNSQAAEGNTWSACPPIQREISSFTCRSLNTYADVGYIPASSGGAPVAPPAACNVGP